jgi:hypothetical protein
MISQRGCQWIPAHQGEDQSEWRGTLIEEELAFPKTKFASGCALLDDFGMQVIGG